MKNRNVLWLSHVFVLSVLLAPSISPGTGPTTHQHAKRLQSQ